MKYEHGEDTPVHVPPSEHPVTVVHCVVDKLAQAVGEPEQLGALLVSSFVDESLLLPESGGGEPESAGGGTVSGELQPITIKAASAPIVLTLRMRPPPSPSVVETLFSGNAILVASVTETGQLGSRFQSDCTSHLQDRIMRRSVNFVQVTPL